MTEPAAHDPGTRRREVGRTARATVGVILLVIVVGFVIDNRSQVRVGYVFGDFKAPLAIIILLTLVVGGMIGWLIGWLVAHRRQQT